MADKTIYNTENEEGTIGALLVDPDTIIDVSPILGRSDFHLVKLGWIYEAINSLYQSNQPVDLLTVSDDLARRGHLSEIGGAAYLSQLIAQTPTGIYAKHYAGLVKRDSVLRQLLRTAGQIAKLAHSRDDEVEDTLIQAQKMVLDLSATNDFGNDAVLLSEVVEEINEDVNLIWQSKGKAIVGLPTGLRDIDKLLGGLQRSAMYVIAGRPGMGKSALAVQIAKYAAKCHRKTPLIFSLEMSDKELGRRILSAESGIEEYRIKSGQIEDGEWESYIATGAKVQEFPIMIDDRPMLLPEQMRAKALQYHMRYGIDMIVVDYIQLMQGHKGQNDNQRVSEASRACKLLARELNIPVIVLSQLSRQCENRFDKRPMLSDLRDSGAIEADADVVGFLYREAVYDKETEFPNIAEFIVSKHRGGPTGNISLYFQKELMTFKDLSTKTHQLNSVDF